MIKFGIIGAGWRSEFYLRIATLLPEEFSVSGIYIRNPEKRAEFAKKYNVSIFDNFDDLFLALTQRPLMILHKCLPIGGLQC